MILKPNMVLPGKDCRHAEPDEVAAATLRVLRRTVPAAVPMGKAENAPAAQDALLKRARLNHLAMPGQYQASMEAD